MAEGLLARLQEDVKSAMKARDKQKLSVLRMLTARVKDAEIAKREAVGDDEIVKLLLTYVKQREDGLAEAKKAGREDLAAQEEFEIELVRTYLPEQLGDDELARIVDEVAVELGVASMKDMGRMMKPTLERVAGRADGGRVSAAVKARLSG